MHCFVLELLASARQDSVFVAAPGALRLAAALCKAEQWPMGAWPAQLQAIPDYDRLSPACSPACTLLSDALAAAAELLRFAPTERLPPLLAASDPGLQVAAALRLSQHPWLASELATRGLAALYGPLF